MEQTINLTEFWGTAEGQDVFRYRLINKNGIEVFVTNFGATVTNIITPDKNGMSADIVLGYDNLEGYINDDYYMGGIVGRFANRIAGGKVELDGKFYQLTVKPGGFHHHGGAKGFNKKVWKPEYLDNTAVKMEYLSPDGEEGFPGDLLVTVVYTLDDNNRLTVDYTATTSKTTLLNLTQHSYFNLGGHDSGIILNHELMMPMDHYLPVNTMQVPDGTLGDVNGTPFDFRAGKPIGLQINEDNDQLTLSAGYDHSWVIKQKNSVEINRAARVTDKGSGRMLTVYTTEPAVHLYTGNFLDGVKGKNKAVYGRRIGFCLETQQFPDAPNKPHFPSAMLEKGKVYRSQTIFEFDTLSASR